MKTLLKLSRGIDALTEWLGNLSNYLVVLIIFVGILNVVLRFLGRWTSSDLFADITMTLIGKAYPSNLLSDTQWYIFAVMFFLGFGYILKHGVNVRVDFLYSKWGARPRALVDFVGTLIFLVPFCLLGIYVSIPQVVQSWGYGSFKPTSDLLAWLGDLHRTGDWEVATENGIMPRAPIKTFVIFGFVFLLLQAKSQAIKYLAILLGHDEVLTQIARDETPEVESALDEVTDRAKETIAAH